jgi:hypothetical protein
MSDNQLFLDDDTSIKDFLDIYANDYNQKIKQGIVNKLTSDGIDNIGYLSDVTGNFKNTDYFSADFAASEHFKPIKKLDVKELECLKEACGAYLSAIAEKTNFLIRGVFGENYADKLAESSAEKPNPAIITSERAVNGANQDGTSNVGCVLKFKSSKDAFDFERRVNPAASKVMDYSEEGRDEVSQTSKNEVFVPKEIIEKAREIVTIVAQNPEKSRGV